MPVNSITYQPATAQLMAAYRPIVFKASATATGGGNLPPYCVCDIYIEDLYYKSVMRTAAESTSETGSIFIFDISDALQEYLQPDLAVITNNNVLQAPHMSAKVFCRFRSSDIDSEGFTVEEPVKPIQATRNTDPVAGTGLQSNTFWVINAALQHEDNQNLATHLNSFKEGEWSADAFPLTHRDRYYFCNEDSDHFPFVYRGDCIGTDLILHYRMKGQSNFQQATATDINVCAVATYQVSVTGNQVTVDLDNPLASGESVLVQYKKQADSVWIDAGDYTTQSFNFNINGSDIAGDYDIRVIHFCTPCLSSDPELDTFTLSGEEINVAWRGIDPFCVLQDLGQTVYISLEVRNQTTDEEFYPDEINPTQRDETTTGDLYVLFFSDVNRLNPLNLVSNNLKIFVKQVQNITDFTGVATYNRVVESAITYTINANGVEALLGQVTTAYTSENFSTYPTISSSTSSSISYDPYPTFQLEGGNTGYLGYTTLEQYNTDTNQPTGVTKPNEFGEPDYIAPVQNETQCPSGPDVTSISYGYALEVSKVQMNYNTIYNYYSTPVNNTGAGGYSFIRPLPKNTNITVSVKAKTLTSGNQTGFIKCRVTYIDGGGNLQTAPFNIPNDIETTLPQMFQNISNINLSNT